MTIQPEPHLDLVIDSAEHSTFRQTRMVRWLRRDLGRQHPDTLKRLIQTRDAELFGKLLQLSFEKRPQPWRYRPTPLDDVLTQLQTAYLQAYDLLEDIDGPRHGHEPLTLAHHLTHPTLLFVEIKQRRELAMSIIYACLRVRIALRIAYPQQLHQVTAHSRLPPTGC